MVYKQSYMTILKTLIKKATTKKNRGKVTAIVDHLQKRDELYGAMGEMGIKTAPHQVEENKKEEKKNIDTVLLLDPKNEEANYMLMEIELKRSNYSKVKELADNFSKICNKLCDKKNSILESLNNLEPKNES